MDTGFSYSVHASAEDDVHPRLRRPQSLFPAGRACRCQCGGKQAALSRQDPAGTFFSLLESARCCPTQQAPRPGCLSWNTGRQGGGGRQQGAAALTFLRNISKDIVVFFPDRRELNFYFPPGAL